MRKVISLSRWAANQRENQAQQIVPDCRKELLESLGFAEKWAPNVPQRFNKWGIGGWVKMQRTE
jgi:hypothetical protein